MAKKQTQLPPGSPEQPQPFGKYFLMGLIARGGMAEVYRCRPRNTTDRILALKCMRPNLASEPRFIEMFIREGKLAVLLEHPNIVRTLEIGRIEGRYFITMDYISGKDLTQVLRKCQEANKRIPVPHAVFIASRTCQGLHYAHTRTDADGRLLNIVNRDVSPSNVRISYDGDVKLLDFGIAQAVLKFTSEIGVLKGKFSYMSPEQIRGMRVDARTDVFSTGILLHEMLTTEKLFRGDSEFDLMEKVRKADVFPPSKFNRRVPPELDELVLKALAREPDDRFSSAAEMGKALDKLITRYKFQQTELRDFLKQLFRNDYQEEQDILGASLEVELTLPGGPAEFEKEQPTHLMVVSEEEAQAAAAQPHAADAPATKARAQQSRWLMPLILIAAVAIVVTALIILFLRK
jgi:serine/threonine protein kinase